MHDTSFSVGNSILAFNLFNKNHFRHSKLDIKQWRCPNYNLANFVNSLNGTINDRWPWMILSIFQIAGISLKKKQSFNSIESSGLSWPFWQGPKVTKTCQSDIQKSPSVEWTETRSMVSEFDLTHVLWYFSGMILRTERNHSNVVIKRNIMVLDINDTANPKQLSERVKDTKTSMKSIKYTFLIHLNSDILKNWPCWNL